MSEKKLKFTAFCGPISLRIAEATRNYPLATDRRPVDYSRDLGMPSDETLKQVSRIVAQDQFEPFDSI